MTGSVDGDAASAASDGGFLRGPPADRPSDGSLRSHGAGLPADGPRRSPPPGVPATCTLRPGDPRFPKQLLTIRPRPKVLFACGDLGVLDQPIVAIVGSRRPTRYGIKVAYEAAREAARAGLVVASGLARGLDARAHRGALDGGGKTIAVLGCGFGVPYPRENVDLLETIPRNGLLLSELAPGSRPTRWSFPARNRIIVGLTRCLLVVEGRAKGGTSNTVRWMQEHNGTVLAVPGRIDEPVAEGPNRLIQDGAWPYLSPQDLLDQFELTWDGGAQPRVATSTTESGAGESRSPAGPRRAPCERSEPSDRRGAAGVAGEPAWSVDSAAGAADYEALESDVLEALSGLAQAEATVYDLVTPDPVHVDRIAERAGLAHGTLLAALSSLEIKGLVTQLPGKQFRLAS